jgi:inosine-uridine nucleoside N-ribohydrolase
MNDILGYATSTIAVLLFSLALPISTSALDQAHYPPSGPFPIIFDTDMSADVDDVGALAVLNAFADAGVCKIIAIGVDVAEPHSCSCADAIMTYYKRPNTPIGIVQNATVTDITGLHWYVQLITEEFPNTIKDSLHVGTMSHLPLAVAVYRRALASQPDTSVVFVCVGLKTALSQLLNSSPDSISPLSGKDLVKKKVRLLADMGGSYPTFTSEWNFGGDGTATYDIINNWPRPIVWLGGEIGAGNMTSGYSLSAKTPVTNTVRRAYEIYMGVGQGRESWDPATALYACRGLGPYYGIHGTGHNSYVVSTATNTWVDANLPGVDQSYLLLNMSKPAVGAVLDSLMILPPRGDPQTVVAGSRIAPRGHEKAQPQARLLMNGADVRVMMGDLPVGAQQRFYDVKGRLAAPARTRTWK